MSGTRVLVTGGNGHLGNTLAKLLCERGYEVRVTVRNPQEVIESQIFAGYDVDIMKADIRDQLAIDLAVEGTEAVFQVAALYNFDEQSLDQGIIANNTEGSQTVLQAAKKHGTARVVFTSSIAAVGFGGSADSPLTEQDWGSPEDPYCRSKLESEKAAWQFAKDYGLDMVSLCPSIILGPNFYKHTPSTVNISAFINNQIPFRFSYQCSIADVRDVAEAHIIAFENRAASGRYIVSGTHVSDLIATLKDVDPEMLLPERTLDLEETKAFAEKAGSPVEMVGQPFIYSDAKAKRDLEWKPRVLAETLNDTIKWIKCHDL